jgi:arylsulfatase A-like enzyme
VTALAVAATLSALFATPACRLGARPVRIVLVTLDTLRHDAVFGGAGRPSAMPSTLARARRGTVFERFFAATSSTQPTHATLFTGRHPWQHGVSRNGVPLGADQLTVAEVLHDAGFSTAAVIGSFPVAGRFGFAQGFDAFDEALTEGELSQGWEGLAEVEEHYYRLAGRVTDAALAQIDHARGSKQFFWFHYFDAHAPYGDTSPGPRLRPFDLLALAQRGVDVQADVARARDLYDKDAASLDAQLDRLFARLEKDAGTYDTHLVVTADHGESFGEDGSLGHGRRVTAPQIHVPFFILSPRLRAGVRRDVAGSVDVPRTIFGLAGVAANSFGGRDLLREASGGRAFGMRRRFVDVQREQRLDRREYPLDRSLFYAVDSDGRIQAGNASALMPGEGSGVASPAPAALQKLFGSFERQLSGAERPASGDAEVEEALRALGYVGG